MPMPPQYNALKSVKSGICFCYSRAALKGPMEWSKFFIKVWFVFCILSGKMCTIIPFLTQCGRYLIWKNRIFWPEIKRHLIKMIMMARPIVAIAMLMVLFFAKIAISFWKGLVIQRHLSILYILLYNAIYDAHISSPGEQSSLIEVVSK